MTRRKVLKTRLCIPDTAFVAANSTLVGEVELGEFASVWFHSVLRGDTDPIRIGHRTNIQDGSILHVDPGFPVEIGDEVTVGHGAVVHGARVGAETLIGMRATILTGALIGRRCIVGAGALVTENFQVPEGSLVLGVPGVVVRKLRPDEIDGLKEHAKVYVDLAEAYRQGRIQVPGRSE